MSWFSRKSKSAGVVTSSLSPAPPSFSPIASPATSASPASSRYASSVSPRITTNGASVLSNVRSEFLDPYATHPDFPSSTGTSFSPSSYRKPTSPSSSSLISGFFSLNGTRSSKRQSDATRSDNGSLRVVEIGPGDDDRGSIRLDMSSNTTSTRNRAYTLSGSTSSSGLGPQTPQTPLYPPTPLRSRSNSTTSSKRLKAHAPPALVAVEEFDPFGGGSTSFILQTPPTPDTQLQLKQPDPLVIRKKNALARKPPPQVRPPSVGMDMLDALEMPKERPMPTLMPVQPAMGPVSAGPQPKRHHLLPFRSKSERERKRAVVDVPALRPNTATVTSNRLSNNSVALTTSSVGTRSRSGSSATDLSNPNSGSQRTLTNFPPSSSTPSLVRRNTVLSPPPLPPPSLPPPPAPSEESHHHHHSSTEISDGVSTRATSPSISPSLPSISTSVRPRPAPIRNEDGSYEFLLPPRVSVTSEEPGSKGYSAPSFIADPGSSPGDRFFASPYPSGVTTVPFERGRDSSDTGILGALITPNLSCFPTVPSTLGLPGSIGAMTLLPPIEQSPPLTADSTSTMMNSNSKFTTPLKIPGASPTRPLPPSPEPSSPLSPVEFRRNPIFANTDAAASTLSFDSEPSEPETEEMEPPKPDEEFGSAPPSAFRARKWSRGESERDVPIASTPRSRTSSLHSVRARLPSYGFMSSAASIKEGEEMEEHGLKRRGSSGQIIPLPPIPSLRHASSFNPEKRASGVHSLQQSKSSSNLSMASGSSAKTEKACSVIGNLVRSGSMRSRRLPSKPALLEEVGPMDETLDEDDEGFDWVKARSRYVDDDSKSLMTLNRIPSVDGHGSIDDHSFYTYEMPSVRTSPRIEVGLATASPGKTDFAPMHILPPSQLLRMADSQPGDEDLLAPDMPPFGQEDDEFGDVGSVLSDEPWATPAKRRDPRTMSTIGIYDGKESQPAPLPPSSIPPHLLNITRKDSRSTPQRRPSASSSASTGTSAQRSARAVGTSVGGPLSPPPLRMRLPRSSISSSTRSFSSALGSPPASLNPLSPPPASRSRANSSGGLSILSQASSIQRGPSKSQPSSIYRGVSQTQRPSAQSMPRRESEASSRTVMSGPGSGEGERRMSVIGPNAMRLKRQTLKPSFLDIDFEDDLPRDSLDDSFLDMSRPSIESVRDY